jgi:hypothetical protein
VRFSTSPLIKEAFLDLGMELFVGILFEDNDDDCVRQAGSSRVGRIEDEMQIS